MISEKFAHVVEVLFVLNVIASFVIIMAALLELHT